MLKIDGSLGEGGGQILRTALGLSMVTGTPVRIEKIRAGRKKPGLRRQHLTAVQAAQSISGAEVQGIAEGSGELTFRPGAVRPGSYRFDVGTAGSTTLVLQTVLPALLSVPAPSQLTILGGTHNAWSPPLDFLSVAFLPLLERMGATVEARLGRHGFFPAGGGRIEVRIAGVSTWKRLDLLDRGPIVSRRARALVARLPRHIAQRELEVVRRRLGWNHDCLAVERIEDSNGPGNVLLLEIRAQHVDEVFAGFGRRGVSAEKVAAGVVTEAKDYLEADVPVGPYLADQLLIPMALAGGGSFRTMPLSQHTLTNIEVIRRLLDVRIVAVPVGEGVVDVEISAVG